MWLDSSFDFGEREYVSFIRVELESDWLIAIVANIQQSVGRRLQLHFTKVDAAARQAHIVA